eukprot:gene13815-15234_t
MIAANKRYLKANLTQGVLNIQTNLVQLYSNNLTILATQAALIGGFSFTAVLESPEHGSLAERILSYFYYVCWAVCLVCCLFILAQATIVVMFGPTMALKGATDDAVKFAANHMREQVFIALTAAWAVITALFIGACILSWAKYNLGVAVITNVVFLVGYAALMVESYHAYRAFVPLDDSAFIEPVVDATGKPTDELKLVSADGKEEEQKHTALQESLAAAHEVVFSFSHCIPIVPVIII